MKIKVALEKNLKPKDIIGLPVNLPSENKTIGKVIEYNTETGTAIVDIYDVDAQKHLMSTLAKCPVPTFKKGNIC